MTEMVVNHLERLEQTAEGWVTRPLHLLNAAARMLPLRGRCMEAVGGLTRERRCRQVLCVRLHSKSDELL